MNVSESTMSAKFGDHWFQTKKSFFQYGIFVRIVAGSS
jgi:hypothetical protein